MVVCEWQRKIKSEICKRVEQTNKQEMQLSFLSAQCEVAVSQANDPY